MAMDYRGLESPRTTAPRHTAQVALLLLILGVALSAQRFPRYVPGTAAAACPASIRAGIDPNDAPWWKLASLPGIGPTRAKAIVRYRGQRATGRFQCPQDLAEVRGIGPKTVERIKPYLVFQHPSSESATPAGIEQD